MASNTALTLKPSDVASATSFIGRSNNATGQQFRGRIKDFRIYSKELTASQVLALSDEQAPGDLAELKASVDLGDTTAVTKNLTLPSVTGMTWSTSNPAVVTAQGVVTRPVAGAGDGQATLTATFTHRGLTDTKTFPITVKQRATIPAAQLATGLVHYYKLNETSGTTLADSGSAGAAGNATLVNPAKAALTGAGVFLNPDAYADSVAGAYVDLPDNITAGMTELSVDYDIKIDPANVGDQHLWSFGRKTTCDGTANGDYQGSIFGSNTMRIRTGLSATTPTTGSSVQRSMTYALREGVWKHLTYTQQRNAHRHDLDRRPLRGRRGDRPHDQPDASRPPSTRPAPTATSSAARRRRASTRCAGRCATSASTTARCRRTRRSPSPSRTAWPACATTRPRSTSVSRARSWTTSSCPSSGPRPARRSRGRPRTRRSSRRPASSPARPPARRRRRR